MRKILVLFLCAAMLLAGCSSDSNKIETLPALEEILVPQETTPNNELQEEIESTTQLLAVSVPAVNEQFTHEDGQS